MLWTSLSLAKASTGVNDVSHWRDAEGSNPSLSIAYSGDGHRTTGDPCGIRYFPDRMCSYGCIC